MVESSKKISECKGEKTFIRPRRRKDVNLNI